MGVKNNSPTLPYGQALLRLRNMIPLSDYLFKLSVSLKTRGKGYYHDEVWRRIFDYNAETKTTRWLKNIFKAFEISEEEFYSPNPLILKDSVIKYFKRDNILKALDNKILEEYKKNNNIKIISKNLVLSRLFIYRRLTNMGINVKNQRNVIHNISLSDGLEAELFFKSLIPEGIDVNSITPANPVYDFDYRGLTIDVKFANVLNCKVYQNKESKYWNFKLNEKADVIVAFLEKNKNPAKYFQDYYTLVVPNYILNRLYKSAPSINETSYLFKTCVIDNHKLKQELDKIVDLKKSLKGGIDWKK